MSRISQRLSNGGGLVCYLTAGFPSEGRDLDYVLACVEGGADVVEIGAPFSDPVADGKVIQYTSQKALENGTTPAKVFDLVRKVRERSDVPIAIMGYYNPIFRIGEERYVRGAKAAGADGFIVPDLPMEESASLERSCSAEGVDLIQLVGPTTSEERMKRIAARSSGFLYVVSSLGTTGARGDVPSSVGGLVARAKKAAGPLPVSVGFGISRPEHVREVLATGANAAIVGSAILQKVIDGESPERVSALVRSLKEATGR
ncbi:tryptophan synthase subunit alpha [Methanomassiliicoccus luminyensis]|uniref:tryptophan synthase subunit alpha n=1 Tax=Methanomassiliicoccus luminyensis TaxID=1080712 RepID=UPI00035E9C2E|nr:tryptophan synthase subunit alpha [Methanomassiliicoccus luminyensis]